MRLQTHGTNLYHVSGNEQSDRSQSMAIISNSIQNCSIISANVEFLSSNESPLTAPQTLYMISD